MVAVLALPVWALTSDKATATAAAWANILALSVALVALYMMIFAGRVGRPDAVTPQSDRVLPWMAPPLDRMVERLGLENELLEALEASAAYPPARTVVLTGEGGFGKTRMAAWACHDARVIATFPGGLLWTSLGQSTQRADLAARVDDLVYALAGKRSGLSDPDAVGAELGRLLDERQAVLLVVDDVWDEAQLRAFRYGGRTVTRLVTTRLEGVAPPDSESIPVGEMADQEAQRVVNQGLTRISSRALNELISLGGNWPVLLNLINGALRRREASGQRLEEAAAHVSQQLRARGPAALDPRNTTERTQAVAATVEASVVLLDAPDRQRYFDLAVFPDDVSIPLDVLELLWESGQEDRLCSELVALGLASDYRLDAPGPRLVLHDVIQAFLRSSHRSEELATAHARIVAGARTLLPPRSQPDGWWEMPAGAGYLWRHIARHMRSGGQTEALSLLLQDLRWAEAKAWHFGSVERVLLDLDLIETKFTRLLRAELEHAAPLLGPIEPRSALGSTMASRLRNVVGLEAAVQRFEDALAAPRLIPEWPLPDRFDRFAGDAPPGHAGAVTGCAFSPDAKRLVTSSDDGTARIWNADSWTLEYVLSQHTGGVWDCDVSRDGSLVATASIDGSCRLWSMESGEQVGLLRAHSSWVHRCVFSPAGGELATASADGTAVIWDVSSQTIRSILSGHTGAVRSCAYSPDGSVLATSGDDGTCRLWRTADGSEIKVLSAHLHGLLDCCFAPSGELLATASYGEVRLWNPTSGAEVSLLAGPFDEVDRCEFSPDGSLLAMATYGRVRIWDLESATEVATLTGHTGVVWGCAFSPDGAWLASGSNDQSVRVWRVADGGTVGVIAGQSSKVNSCAYSPDGSLLATTSYDSSVQLWDVSGATRRSALVGHTDRVISCSFSPNGHFLASTSFQEVRVWVVSEAGGSVVLAGHTDWVRSCSFSPDNSLLATASADRTLRLWSVGDWSLTRVLDGHTAGVRSCAFSPDGSTIASAAADGRVLLFRAADGRVQAELNGHSGGVQSCAYSPDGQLLATASGDRTVRIWRVNDGKEMYRLTGHTSWADRCAFSPNGQMLATASNDQTLRIWHVETGECLCAIRVAAPLVWVSWHPGGELLCTVGGAGTYVFRYRPQTG